MLIFSSYLQMSPQPIEQFCLHCSNTYVFTNTVCVCVCVCVCNIIIIIIIIIIYIIS